MLLVRLSYYACTKQQRPDCLNDVTDARGGGYMSFGQSGSDTASEMTGADVFVAFWSERGDPTVVDYKLTAKAQVLYKVFYTVYIFSKRYI